MEKKVLLADLADALAKKGGITKKSADAFVRAFFSTIEQNLLEDNYVKVKNFGTFKIIRVNERESVNIATGERIQIGSHAKVNFTPEGTLRDQVNLPFAHFTNVELNDDTPLEELEEVETPEEVAEPAEEAAEPAEEAAAPTEDVAAPEPQPEPETAIEEPEAAIEEPEAAIEEPEAAIEEPQTVEPEGKPAENTEEVPKEILTPNTDLNDDDIMEQPTNWWKVACISIIVVLLMIMSYFAGYYRLFSPNNAASAAPTTATVEATDTLSLTTPATASDSLAATSASMPKEATPKYEQLPNGKYEIVGIKEEIIFRPGMTLTKLARKYYNDTDLAEYIVFHNKISNPDIVDINAKIQIPELRARE